MLLGMLGAILLAMVGCAEADPPVLSVGDIGYSADELGALGMAQQEDLALITAFGLVVADGRVEELAGSLAARERREDLKDRLVSLAALERSGLRGPDLRRAYRQSPEHRLVVRHLVILSETWENEEERREARRAAAAARSRIEDGEDFAEVAGEVSEEPGAADRGGLLEPAREGDWVPEFWRAADALREGEISPVVETPYGFHVLRLEERRPIPLEEATAETLRNLVRRAGAAAELHAAEQWVDSIAEGDAGADRLRQEAADRGLELAAVTDSDGVGPTADDDVGDAERTAWIGRIAGWAGSLGFAPGMENDELKTRALSTLGSSNQQVALARSAVLELAPVLRRMVEIEYGSDQSSSRSSDAVNIASSR